MDWSNHALNAVFIIGIFVVFAVSVWALIKAVTSNNTTMMVLSGAFVFALVVGAVLFWSDGYIRTTMSEKIKALFSSSAAIAASVSPINVRVDVPNQAPPTTATQNNTSSSGTESSATGNSDSTISSDRTEIFDLGSQVAGHFDDGTPYRLHEVRPGDTVYRIKNLYGVTEDEIVRYNNLDIRRRIVVGRTLKIPIH